MEYGKLSSHFTGVAYKSLVEVELPRRGSNQHEFNGSLPLRELLGAARIDKAPAQFMFLSDSEEKSVVEDGVVTWYDSRDAHPTRSEYRLYYSDNTPMAIADPGDLLVIAKKQSGTLLIIVAEQGSTVERQLEWLFGLGEVSERRFSGRLFNSNAEPNLQYGAVFLLQQLGISIAPAGDRDNELLSKKYGLSLPTTREFSRFAREQIASINDYVSMDEYLLACFEKEESLFRSLEKMILEKKIEQGFAGVDEFVSFSLSIHNRRKSRAGYALENHLEHILKEKSIRYDRGKTTEGKSKPDFLFPGQSEYLNTSYRTDCLTMLGVKTTCKDRWRQVLAEASRIQVKHLLTLEGGISKGQTDEMKENSIKLVIPRKIHGSYSDLQANELMCVDDFLDLVRQREQL